MSDQQTPRDTSRHICSLSPNALADRTGAWQMLTARALSREIDHGRVVSRYPDTPDIEEQLTRLIDAEKDCCPFLDFHVEREQGQLRVELRYPPLFAAMLAAVSAPNRHDRAPGSLDQVIARPEERPHETPLIPVRFKHPQRVEQRHDARRT